MIPKSNKLVYRKEITKAVRTKFRTNSDFFVIYLSKHQAPEFKLLVTVSKKISKSSPVRNRIRRRINGVLFDKFANLPHYCGCIIQVTSLDILRTTPLQLQDAILSSMNRGVLQMTKELKHHKPQQQPHSQPPMPK